MEVKSPPRVGFVGLGTTGQVYASIAREAGCEIIGTDAEPRGRERFKEAFDVGVYDDFMGMYDEDIDAVFISTPNRYHERATVAALDKGIDVLLEKPLAHNFESAERIVDAAESSLNNCFPTYYLSFHDWARALRSFIDDGYFGRITHIEARYIYRRGVPNRGSWFTSKEIAGGGALQDKGSFALELLAYFGVPLHDIHSIKAKRRTEFGHQRDYTPTNDQTEQNIWSRETPEQIFDVEDSLSAFLEFGDGTTLTLETAWAANDEKQLTFRLRGTDGGAYLDLQNGRLQLFGVEPDEPRSLVTEEIEPDYSDALFQPRESDEPTLSHLFLQDRVFRDFIEHVGETPPDSTVENRLHRALDTQQAISEIYAATAHSGR